MITCTDDPLPEIFEKLPIPKENNNEANQESLKIACRIHSGKEAYTFLTLILKAHCRKLMNRASLPNTQKNAEIIGFTESKLDKAMLISEVKIDYYEVKRLKEIGKRGTLLAEAEYICLSM